jgi:hypothetical protein
VTTREVLVKIGVESTSGQGLVVGTAANVAARIQGLAPPGGVVVDAQTHHVTRAVFEYDELDPATVKGVSDPLRIYRPRRPFAAVRARRRVDLDVPLVGRDRELGLLVEAFEKVVANRQAALLVVSGEPGLGKSRLVAALRERLDSSARPPLWRLGTSLPYGDEIGAWSLAEIVRSQAAIEEPDDSATALAKLDAVLPEGTYGDWLLRRLAPILGLDAAPAANPDETVTAYLGFLELLAHERPAVVVFEDIHWADDTVVALLARLAENPAEAPLLVVATTRPELFDRRGPAVAAIEGRVVELTRLSDKDIASLAASLLHGAAPSSELEETIQSSAGGNALYAGEIVHLLQDRGALIDDGGVWRLAEGEPVELPGSTQALISARLDTLPATQLAVIGDASVVGETFWVGSLAALGKRPVDDVVAALDELVRRHHVAVADRSTFPGTAEFRFTHSLVRDAAYAQLTRRDRADKHRAAAHWIEQSSADRITEVVDVLAHHTCTALELTSGREAVPELSASALHYSSLAAERNIALDTRAAAHHLARALALADDLEADHTKLLSLGGQIALNEGRPKDAAEMLEEAASAFREAGDVRAAVRTMITLGYVYEHLGSTRGFELADETVALLEDGPTCIELVQALAQRAGTKTISGDPRAGIEMAERAFAAADELGVERPSVALGYRGIARCYLGDMGGVEDLRQAAALGAAHGDGRDAGVTYVNLQAVEHLARGPAVSLEVREAATEFAARRGLAEMVEFSRIYALEPLLDLGRIDELLDLAGELEQHAEAVGSDYSLFCVRSALLRTWAQIGDHARIAETAAWLDPAARSTGAPEDLAVGLAACAIGLGAIGENAAVCSLVEELVAASAGSQWSFAPRLPGLVRAAVVAGGAQLGRRVVESATHRTPYADAARAAAGGVPAEAEGDYAAAATAYLDGARLFAELGVALERWLALAGAERSLRACGDAAGAEQAALTGREVLASMPALQPAAYGASSAPTK